MTRRRGDSPGNPRTLRSGRLVRQFRIAADGRGNWEGIGGDTPADPQAKRRHVTIDGVDLTDSRLTFVDQVAARRVEITALNLTTGAIDPGKPFTATTIAGLAHMQGFAPEGVRFRVVVPEAALSEDYSALDVPKFSVELGGMQSEGTIRGTGGLRITGEQCETSVPGLFAAGDTATRELITGAVSGGGSPNSAWALTSGLLSGAGAAALAKSRGRRLGDRVSAQGTVGLHPRRNVRAVDRRAVLKSAQDEILPLDKNVFRSASKLKRFEFSA